MPKQIPWAAIGLYLGTLIVGLLALGVHFANRLIPELRADPVPNEFLTYSLGQLFTLLLVYFRAGMPSRPQPQPEAPEAQAQRTEE